MGFLKVGTNLNWVNLTTTLSAKDLIYRFSVAEAQTSKSLLSFIVPLHIPYTVDAGSDPVVFFDLPDFFKMTLLTP
jgi:hypothetical protein